MKNPTTKVETVIALASRKSGVTIAEIITTLRVAPTIASSLIADARGKGIKVKYDVESGRYYATSVGAKKGWS